MVAKKLVGDNCFSLCQNDTVGFIPECPSLAAITDMKNKAGDSVKCWTPASGKGISEPARSIYQCGSSETSNERSKEQCFKLSDPAGPYVAFRKSAEEQVTVGSVLLSLALFGAVSTVLVAGSVYVAIAKRILTCKRTVHEARYYRENILGCIECGPQVVNTCARIPHACVCPNLCHAAHVRTDAEPQQGVSETCDDVGGSDVSEYTD